MEYTKQRYKTHRCINLILSLFSVNRFKSGSHSRKLISEDEICLYTSLRCLVLQFMGGSPTGLIPKKIPVSNY